MVSDAGEPLELQLRDGLTGLGLRLGDNQIDRLLGYLQLLRRWNQAYNLTAVAVGEEMVTRHLLDSLSIAPYLQGESFVDVGSGAGLPGIPLAIALPDNAFTLVDSNGKKTRFLLQVRARLKLANVREVHRRVADYRPDGRYDGVISRAYAALTDLAEASVHLLKSDGRIYAMKGHYPVEELSGLPKAYKVSASHRLNVPGLVGERHLIVMTCR